MVKVNIVKGAVGKIGVEADFTTIIGAKRISISTAEQVENDLLTITDEESTSRINLWALA